MSSTALRASAAREPVHRASLALEGKAPSRGARSARTAPNETTRFTCGIYSRRRRDSRRDDVSFVDLSGLWRFCHAEAVRREETQQIGGGASLQLRRAAARAGAARDTMDTRPGLVLGFRHGATGGEHEVASVVLDEIAAAR